MVHKIAELKDRALERMEKEIQDRGVDRADLKELGELADIVKDLASAEKDCWEAEYYMTVTEAMGSGSGYMYDGTGMGDGMGYNGGTTRGMGSMDSRARQGYRDSRGRYARRGYTGGIDDDIQSIRQAMTSATPEERERMQRELRQLIGM